MPKRKTHKRDEHRTLSQEDYYYDVCVYFLLPKHKQSCGRTREIIMLSSPLLCFFSFYKFVCCCWDIYDENTKKKGVFDPLKF